MGFRSWKTCFPVRFDWLSHNNFLIVTFKVADSFIMCKWFKRQVIWHGFKVSWEAKLLFHRCILERKKREYEVWAENKQSYLAAVWNGLPGCWNIAPGLQRQLVRDMAHVHVDQNPCLFSFTVMLTSFHCEAFIQPSLSMNDVHSKQLITPQE